MVTTVESDVPNAEPNEARIIAEKAIAATRVAVAGHPQGAIRRILLYTIVAVALGGAGGYWWTGPISLFFVLVGLVAVVLLATTDDLQ